MEWEQATKETDINYRDLTINAPRKEENCDKRSFKPILEKRTKECQEIEPEICTIDHWRDETHL